MLSYGDNDSNGLLYNLYADCLLRTELVPRSVYEMQSAFYPTVTNRFGVPLDTRHESTKGDWEIYVASIASASTRDLFISYLVDWLNESPTSGPTTNLYDTNDGGFAHNVGMHFLAQPVLGSWSALLTLGGDVGVPEG